MEYIGGLAGNYEVEMRQAIELSRRSAIGYIGAASIKQGEGTGFMANRNTGQMGEQTRSRQIGRSLRGTTAVIAGVAAVAASLGCAATLAPSPTAEISSSYTVGAPDSLAIEILPEPAISAAVMVRPDGMITVPLIGDVQAGGRTIPEIAADIEERIARFKRDPRVTVALAGAASTDIVVLGEVAQQSSFPLVKDTRIVEAIGMVGGTTAFGWDSRIRVIRSEKDATKILRVNLNAIRKGDLRTNVMLQPRDIVYVPPTPWAQFGYALNTMLFPFQSIIGVARTVGGNLLTPGGN